MGQAARAVPINAQSRSWLEHPACHHISLSEADVDELSDDQVFGRLVSQLSGLLPEEELQVLKRMPAEYRRGALKAICRRESDY